MDDFQKQSSLIFNNYYGRNASVIIIIINVLQTFPSGMVPGCCLAMSVVIQLTILNCVINSPQIFYDINQRHLLSCASVCASTLNAAKRTRNFITSSCMAAACNLHILNIQTQNMESEKNGEYVLAVMENAA